MRLNDARALATDVLAMLRPACLQAEIAGSIRREKADIKDIELVVQPRLTPEPTLFGDGGRLHSDLDAALARLIAAGRLAYDTKLKRNGERYKRLTLPGRDMAIDLFIADALNWGNILAIRTGDADFSRALVTSRLHGGLMPGNLKQRDGVLVQGQQVIVCDACWRSFERLHQHRLQQAERRLLAAWGALTEETA